MRQDKNIRQFSQGLLCLTNPYWSGREGLVPFFLLKKIGEILISDNGEMNLQTFGENRMLS